jgi:hypothetical protein
MVIVATQQNIVAQVVRKTMEHVLQLLPLHQDSVVPHQCMEKFPVRVVIAVLNMVIVGRVRPTVELVVDRTTECVQDHQRVVRRREDRLQCLLVQLEPPLRHQQ